MRYTEISTILTAFTAPQRWQGIVKAFVCYKLKEMNIIGRQKLSQHADRRFHLQSNDIYNDICDNR